MHKDILRGNSALEKLLKGTKALSDCVNVTYGGKGRNVLIYQSDRSRPRITKDGVSVSREVILKDNTEDAAAMILNEAASKTASLAGDGTTATIILTNKIFEEGVKLIKEHQVHPQHHRLLF